MTFCGSQEAPIDYFLLDVSIFPQLLIKPFAFFQKPRFFLQILCRGSPCTPCVPTRSQPATSPSHIRLSILRLTSMYFPHTVTRQPPLGLWPPSPALSPACFWPQIDVIYFPSLIHVKWLLLKLKPKKRHS